MPEATVSSAVHRFRKRPVEIQAIQFNGSNHDDIRAFTNGRFWAIDPRDRGDNPDIVAQVYDALHDTFVGVKVTDWIAQGVRGEFYPIDDIVMADTYEAVDDAR